jgi:hypothetical protein
MGKIIFKFLGGPFDGKTVTGSPGEEGDAQKYYALSHHGRMGQRFRVASEYMVNTLAAEQLQEQRPHRFPQHFYEVVDRIDNRHVLFVRVKYVETPVRAKS